MIFGTGEKCADTIFSNVVFVHRVQIVCILTVISARNDYTLFVGIAYVCAAKRVDLWQLVALRLQQLPNALLCVELEYLVGRTHVAGQPAHQVDAPPAADERVLRPGPGQVARGFDLLPVEALDAVVEVDGVEVGHHAFEYLVPAVNVHSSYT